MSRSAVTLSDELRAWLGSDAHALTRWDDPLPIEELRCHPDLVELVEHLARAVRGTVRVWVTGCPVLHHPAGAPIAYATGTACFAVRSGAPAGALASRWETPGLDRSWVDLDPWAADVTFTKTRELLRSHLRRAYQHAEAGTWP